MAMAVYLKKESFEQLMAEKNLAQVDLAKKLGIAEEYLSQLKTPEKYRLSPGPKLRARILKILGVEFSDIFFIHDFRCSGNNQTGSTSTAS
jgi:transcriptional regulator with XRE-family HTH domain